MVASTSVTFTYLSLTCILRVAPHETWMPG
jgi:hypothetical protein